MRALDRTATRLAVLARAGRAQAPRALTLVVAGLAVLTLALVALDRTASYRSPLYGAEAAETPRSRALGDLAAWTARKKAEEARVAELMRTLDTPKMVVLGRDIVHGRGLCFNCHHIGAEGRGRVGPDLDGVGGRAATRVAGMSDLEYLAQSLYQPSAFIVPDFPQSMTPANQPPIGLTNLEIRMVVAYLQSLGGTPSVKPDTKLPFSPEE